MLEQVTFSLYIALNRDPADNKPAFAQPWSYVSMKSNIMAKIYHEKDSIHVESPNYESMSFIATHIALNVGPVTNK